MAQEYVDIRLQEILGSAERPQELSEVRKLFDSYLRGEIVGFEFPGDLSDFLKRYSGSDRERLERQLFDVAIEADKIGRETGTKYDIIDLITPQEHALLQSGKGEEGVAATNEPYMPYILINNSNTEIENVSRHRANIRSRGAHAFYFGLEGDLVRISVEPLDEHGRTLRDPVPLDEQLNPIPHYVKSPNFPFRRD